MPPRRKHLRRRATGLRRWKEVSTVANDVVVLIGTVIGAALGAAQGWAEERRMGSRALPATVYSALTAALGAVAGAWVALATAAMISLVLEGLGLI